jgi:hypothetical protein
MLSLRSDILTAGIVTAVIIAAVPCAGAQTDPRLQPYIDVLRERGRPPLEFVLDKLDEYDLLVFDDAWHPCEEPFEFYVAMVGEPRFHNKVKRVFVEALPINRQPNVDAYLASEPEDVTLLYPAFQNDLSGTGWPLESYFDLLHAVWEVDHPAGSTLAEEEQMRVVCVNAPTYWSEMKTAEDVTLFRQSLLSNDYTMYRVIEDEMDGFGHGRKGVFLTNTRHAYKGIRDRDMRLYWDSGTFLHERHPGKTYSIRFHNMMLSIEGERATDASTPQTTAGTERLVYTWIRMGNGLWDSAFEAMGNHPLAFPLQGNVFGAHRYVGNHMLNAAPGQTMADANDAIIFLAPIEELHNTARVDWIYTPEFKRELARRYRLLYTSEQLDAMMERARVTTLEVLIDHDCAATPREPIPQAKKLSPRGAWK